MYDVFISYSSKDENHVRRLCSYLEEHGIKCFVSYRDIPSGMTYPAAITRAIRDSKMLLLVLTSDSNISEQVDRELTLAADNKRLLSCFRLEDVAYSDSKAYLMSGINWLDGFPNPNERYHQLLRDICKRIENVNVSDSGLKSTHVGKMQCSDVYTKIDNTEQQALDNSNLAKYINSGGFLITLKKEEIPHLKKYLKSKSNDYIYMFWLGELYMQESDSMENQKLAYYAFYTAFEHGIYKAGHYLCQMYMKGIIVPKDLKRAAMYMRMAKQNS